MNVLNHLYNNAKECLNKQAIICDDVNLNYYEFFAYVLGVSINLKENGVKNGDKIVIKCHQNGAFLIYILGIQLLGCVMVPVEPDISNGRLREIKDEIGEFKFIDEYKFSDFIPATKSQIENFKQENIPNDDMISEILYTTGTTGIQKGIIHKFSSQYAAAMNALSVIKIPKNNKTLITCPLNHSFSIRRFYASIITQSATALTSGVVPLEKFYECIEKWQITACVLAPSALGIILSNKNFDIGKNLQNLSYIEFAGSYLQENFITQTKELVPNLKIYNIFGSTEFGCATGIDETKEHKKSCIGKPTINTEVFILDNDGNKLKDGQKGYLALKGSSFMVGYVGDNKATQSLISKNGAYVTQDICYKEDGLIYFVGRDSDVINIGGLKVSPDEIENIANSYEFVSKSGCVPKVHELAGHVPVLFVEIKDGFDMNDFYAFLRAHLQAYQFPKDVIIVEKIPFTYNGKINRKALKELL